MDQVFPPEVVTDLMVIERERLEDRIRERILNGPRPTPTVGDIWIGNRRI